jgi:putative transposase
MTDSDHECLIFRDLARDRIIDGPEPTLGGRYYYTAFATGFVYLAAVLDAWSRRVIGYATSRSIDARVAVAALKTAIRARQPPKGCIHHSDRGSQYASETCRAVLADHGLVGSMGRRGNPYDNAKAKLHEDAQGRRSPSDGLPDLRGGRCRTYRRADYTPRFGYLRPAQFEITTSG